MGEGDCQRMCGILVEHAHRHIHTHTHLFTPRQLRHTDNQTNIFLKMVSNYIPGRSRLVRGFFVAADLKTA